MLSFLGTFGVHCSLAQSDSEKSSSMIPCSFPFSSWKSVATESVAEFITIFENTLLWQHIQTLQKQGPAEQ